MVGKDLVKEDREVGAETLSAGVSATESEARSRRQERVWRRVMGGPPKCRSRPPPGLRPSRAVVLCQTMPVSELEGRSDRL